MKKYIIIAAAALVASVACSKVQTVEPQKEINFEVANSLQTKASGSLYNNGAFGTYAWFTANPGAGSDHAPFMVNETVDLVGGVWKTSLHTFYWPKTGSVEFISYSPFSGTNATADSNPAVTQNTITYTNLTAGDVDYMYADKATASKNVNMVTDGVDSGYSGVPTIFRHALAKLSFKIKANFVKYTDPTTNTTTTWDVTVKSAKISGFYTTGDCTLNLDMDSEGVTMPWKKPAGEVWTNLSGATDEQELVNATTYPTGILLPDPSDPNNNPIDLEATASTYVIPQNLETAKQKIQLNVHITTHLSNGLVIEEDFTPTIDIKDISSLSAWKMNQNIVYTISIKPTAIADPNNNDNPNDVIITFDPAVADWTNVDAAASIQL